MSLLSMRSLMVNGLLVVGAVATDQWIKHMVETSMELGETIEVLPFIALHHARNEGVAFSMFSGSGSGFLSAVSVAVMVLMVWLWSRTTGDDRWARLGFALILGGAFGNLIDRAMLGYVTDYILFHTPVWSFAIFNLADAFISVGATLVVFQELVHWWRGDTEVSGERPD